MDVDGEEVTVTTSKGTDEALLDAATLTASGGGQILRLLDLSSNPAFKGTHISITTDGTGDGLVAVGYIDATGLDLGNVTIAGDLGRIDSGDGKTGSPGLKKLEVETLGVSAQTTLPTGTTSDSTITGPLRELRVEGNMVGALTVEGGNNGSGGKIASVFIGGSLIGGADSFSGSILASNSIGRIEIGGDILGGAGAGSGSILTSKTIKSVEVAGDVVGGLLAGSGSIATDGTIKSILIGGDLVGGSTTVAGESGQIKALKNISFVEIGGSLIGGAGAESGAILAGDALGTAIVRGSVFGGGGFESGTIGSLGTVARVTIEGLDGEDAIQGGSGRKSGAILSASHLVHIEVNGTIRGGTGESSGVIASDGKLKQVVLGGSLIGGEGRESGAIGSEKAFGDIHVSENIIGGSGPESGRVVSKAGLREVIVDGAVLGGGGFESGTIGTFGTIKSVSISGALQGGNGESSGSVVSGVALPSVQLGGDLIAGAGARSGSIVSAQNLGMVSIGGSIDAQAESVGVDSGLVFAGGKINKATITGSIWGGNNTSAGAIRSDGGIGEVVVETSVMGGAGEYSGSIRSGGPIGTVVVDGTLFGSLGAFSASISTTSPGSEGAIRSITVTGSIFGGDGERAGAIASGGTLGTVTIGTPGSSDEGTGYLAGGYGPESGSIYASGIGAIVVERDAWGGSGTNAGRIYSDGDIARIIVGGSLRGGIGSFFDRTEGPENGHIFATGTIHSVEIGEDISGGEGGFSGAIQGAALKSIHVGGNVTAGNGFYSASLLSQTTDIARVIIEGTLSNSNSQAGYHAASISAQRFLGSVELGAIDGDSEGTIYITAGGVVGATGKSAVAIDRLIVTGSVRYAQILAGYDANEFGFNPDAQIKLIQVGSSESETVLFETDIVAGISHGGDFRFGTFDDQVIEAEGSTERTLSTIHRLEIAGAVTARGRGIVAEEVKFISVNGEPELQLQKGPRNDFFLLAGDTFSGMRVSELPPNIPVPSF